VASKWKPEEAWFKGFARIPEQIIRIASLEWTRDETALYLLHCRGYSPKDGGSLYGYDGARRLLRMSSKEWKAATESLESKNLTRAAGTANRPVTILAHPSRMFEPGQRIENGSCKESDGHGPELTRDHGHILVPWRVFDEDWDDPGIRIGYVESAEALRLLVACYPLAREDGRLPSNLLWLRMEGKVGPACERRTFAEACGLFPEDVEKAARELLRVGLLDQRDVDKRGRGVLYLHHSPILGPPEEA